MYGMTIADLWREMVEPSRSLRVLPGPFEPECRYHVGKAMCDDHHGPGAPVGRTTGSSELTPGIVLL